MFKARPVPRARGSARKPKGLAPPACGPPNHDPIGRITRLAAYPREKKRHPHFPTQEHLMQVSEG